MTGWKLRPARHVVQIVFQHEDGSVEVFATASRPVPARRLIRKLRRKYGETPPHVLMPANGKAVS